MGWGTISVKIYLLFLHIRRIYILSEDRELPEHEFPSPVSGGTSWLLKSERGSPLSAGQGSHALNPPCSHGSLVYPSDASFGVSDHPVTRNACGQSVGAPWSNHSEGALAVSDSRSVWWDWVHLGCLVITCREVGMACKHWAILKFFLYQSINVCQWCWPVWTRWSLPGSFCLRVLCVATACSTSICSPLQAWQSDCFSTPNFTTVVLKSIVNNENIEMSQKTKKSW